MSCWSIRLKEIGQILRGCSRDGIEAVTAGPQLCRPKTRDGKLQGAHSCAAKDKRRKSTGGPQLCRQRRETAKYRGPTVVPPKDQRRQGTGAHSQLKCQPSKGPQIRPGPWPTHPSQFSTLQYLQCTWIYCLPQVYDIAYNPPTPYPLSFNDLGADWENSATQHDRGTTGLSTSYNP